MSLCVFYPQHLFVLQLLVCLTIAVGVSVHYRYARACSSRGVANGVLGCFLTPPPPNLNDNLVSTLILIQ